MNVKGEGYAIQHRLSFEGGLEETLSSTQPNSVNFGSVQINDKRTKNIVVSNYGKYPFDFSWTHEQNQWLTITPGKHNIENCFEYN
jgi:hypothetical protein